jgi:hypothetical protein
MHPDIEKLIDLAIADGQITEKERNVILKKASQLGVDEDEAEMYLDGKLHQMKNQANKPTKEKHGNIKTCPACGAEILSFTSKCLDCGHEFTGLEASKTIKVLFEKLENIEKERNTIKLEKSYINKLINDERQNQEQIDEIICKKRASVIRDFPIPNSREELLELLHFIKPKILNTGSHDPNFYDWKTKFTEIIERVKVSYRNDNIMLSELKYFEVGTKVNILSYYKQLDKNKKNSIFVLLFLILSFSFLTSTLMKGSSNHEKGIKREKERLEIIMNQINQSISIKDYQTALILSAQLKWEFNDGYSDNIKELSKSWDEKRDKLIEILNREKINQKK